LTATKFIESVAPGSSIPDKAAWSISTQAGISQLAWGTLVSPIRTTARDQKHEALLDSIYEMVEYIGAASVCPSQAVVLKQPGAKGAFLRFFALLDYEARSGKFSTLRHLAKHFSRHEASEASFLCPSVMALHRWFEKISQGGPTAAPGAYQALLWWRRHAGFPFPLDD
jgi:hypothetical protein